MNAVFITAPSLAAPGIRHAFFTRQGGVSETIYASLNGGRGSKDDPDAVIENRRRMTDTLGVENGMLATPHQIHSAEVVTAFTPWLPGTAPQADAVVTSTPGLAVGIATADCGPILFADPVGRVIGAAHAGWKGALGGVVEATVAAMVELGSARRDIVAVLGPTISQAAYEVDDGFRRRFEADIPGSHVHFAPGERAGHAQFDRPGFIAERFRDAGIGAATSLGLCTYADPQRFYSFRRTTHRREADYGRLISAIALLA